MEMTYLADGEVCTKDEICPCRVPCNRFFKLVEQSAASAAEARAFIEAHEAKKLSV